MKRIIVITVLAVMALATANNASAQRKTVPYASLGPLASFTENNFGVGVAGGIRNYNRNAFVSFAPSLELFAEAFPADKRFGAFLVPEIGVAIGPKGFKFYPHTGLMLGYDTGSGTFAWGGKSGTAFDFGQHFTLDFCTYMPAYDLTAIIWAANFVWRF